MNPKNNLLFLLILLLVSLSVSAQQNDALLKDSGWSYHFQFTGIIQWHPSFDAPYSGQNSLQPKNERAFSVTSTFYLGRKLWKGASIYFNPEMAGGKGVSSTLGIAGFPNGETFRVGNPEPTVYVGRIFLRQHIALTKDEFEEITDDVNQVKEKVPVSRITLSLGKFCMADFFDDNNISHDPRTDFMNWGLMNNGAYDYAANTRGYTYGLVAEYIQPSWALRIGTALLPKYANGPDLDLHYFKTSSQTIELEKKYSIHSHKGTVRILGYYNVSKAPDYNHVVDDKISGIDTSMDVIYGKDYGKKKFGFGLNAEQELGKTVNGFLRFGWNDGKTATWAFAEIDNTLSLGIRIAGDGWKRAADNIGIALLSNGISSAHRRFLDAGGYGFMIGDGKLPDYGRENITEVFYESKIFNRVMGTVDYQFVMHPAYNKERGPAHMLAARMHIEL